MGGLCSKRLPTGPSSARRWLQARRGWTQAGVESVELVVRAVSGSDLLRQEVTFDTRVADLVGQLSSCMGDSGDTLKLLHGSEELMIDSYLGEGFVPTSPSGLLELTLVQSPGPLVRAKATSGRRIDVVNFQGKAGGDCHFDRTYKFISLGYFEREGMLYIKTSNEDKNMSNVKLMWELQLRNRANVYLNFRSRSHLRTATGWLAEHGWESVTVRSTVSSGIPNGPYAGPVYTRTIEPGRVQLMGSNCREGTYFVFVEPAEDGPSTSSCTSSAGAQAPADAEQPLLVEQANTGGHATPEHPLGVEEERTEQGLQQPPQQMSVVQEGEQRERPSLVKPVSEEEPGENSSCSKESRRIASL